MQKNRVFPKNFSFGVKEKALAGRCENVSHKSRLIAGARGLLFQKDFCKHECGSAFPAVILPKAAEIAKSGGDIREANDRRRHTSTRANEQEKYDDRPV